MPDSLEGLRLGQNNEFSLRMAVEGEDRLKCWNLVYREYLNQGYTAPNELQCRYSLHDALPDTATFLIELGPESVGTVTVFPDSPLGLPADEIYRAELDGLRQAGHRPVEIGRLTIAREHANNRFILAGLFDILFLHAREVIGATDLVSTVNPSHEKFYERMLIFQRIGTEKDLGSVRGAPAVLMKMDLDRQREMIYWAHGQGPKPAWYAGSGQVFSKFVSSPGESVRKVEWLKGARQRPGEQFLRQYFMEKRALLREARETIRQFFLDSYPTYNLGLVVVAAENQPPP